MTSAERQVPYRAGRAEPSPVDARGTCGHQTNADLQALVNTGRGNVPLVRLKWRRNQWGHRTITALVTPTMTTQGTAGEPTSEIALPDTEGPCGLAKDRFAGRLGCGAAQGGVAVSLRLDEIAAHSSGRDVGGDRSVGQPELRTV